MCGILCCLFFGTDEGGKCPLLIHSALQALLKNRGPDHNNTIQIEPNLSLSGYVLWQQGREPCPQPVVSNNWALLLNGDIFNSQKDTSQSDTFWLSEQLDKTKNDNEIVDIVKSLQGPYSVIFYNRNSKELYFARDSLGRNSLLLEKNENIIQISSTSYIKDDSSECVELPPLGLFKLSTESSSELHLYPWQELRTNQSIDIENLEKLLSTRVIVNKSLNPEWLLNKKNKDLFDFYSILNVNIPENVFSKLLQTQEIVNKSVQQLLTLLNKSVKDRVLTTAPLCIKCASLSPKPTCCTHSKVGILFSGGIDCTILAAIANSYIDPDTPIDLLNVAFEKTKSTENSCSFDVPDRCSAKESYLELNNLFPLRQWNLIEVNVTREELQRELKAHIRNVIHPLKTVLDESLGCAFWFASRGSGLLDGTPYQTTSRVILVGSGADELFGGYVRHRNAYNRCKGTHIEKLEALHKELDMDWERIPSRNLGRDDRVIADNRKTSRAPFIEEDIVDFVRSLQPEERCCFLLPEGVGDKLLLRLCGHELGLRSSTQLKKRAIQFGSRIADKNQNAKDLSVYLQKIALDS